MALLIRSRLHFYHVIQVAKNDNSRINRQNNRGWPHHHNWRVSLQSPQQEHRNSLSFPLLRAASSVLLLVIKKRKSLIFNFVAAIVRCRCETGGQGQNQ